MTFFELFYDLFVSLMITQPSHRKSEKYRIRFYHSFQKHILLIMVDISKRFTVEILGVDYEEENIFISCFSVNSFVYGILENNFICSASNFAHNINT